MKNNMTSFCINIIQYLHTDENNAEQEVENYIEELTAIIEKYL